MGTEAKYVLPLETSSWTIAGEIETVFRWEYEDGRAPLLALYEKGKAQQWNAQERIDWSEELHPENPMQLPDWIISIYNSPIWAKLSPRQIAEFRRHIQAWQISQFLHGEQGALICAAKIVQQVESIDAKFYAATQVIDEARHVEAYSRLLSEKFALAYPINKQLAALIEDVIRRKEWDFTYLGMQVVIEGLALAAFQGIRDHAQNRLAAQVNAYVMQDEARHVAFGRLALRDLYPQLTASERALREEFLVEACHLMRDRLMPVEAWEGMGLDVAACRQFHEQSEAARQFRTRLFRRIVPTVKDIGLWGPSVQRAFEAMGVLDFAAIDTEALLAEDSRVAAEFDADRRARAPAA
jgi:hypothetical protein